MSNLELKDQEDIFATLASSLSTALESGKEGKLTPHQGCKLNSEKSCRAIPFSPSLATSQNFCAVPCLSLKKRGQAASRSTKAAVQNAAAKNLAEPMSACQNDMHLLPERIVRNISDSFLSLVDSRFRSYLAVLSEQSKRDPGTFSPLLNMFSAVATRPIQITTIVSTFRILEKSTKFLQANKATISSLVQETVIDLNILGEPMTVELCATGAFHGVFDHSGSTETSLLSAAILIDTNSLLQSMVGSARQVVRLAKDKVSTTYLLSLTQPIASQLPPNLNVGTVSTESIQAGVKQQANQLPANLNCNNISTESIQALQGISVNQRSLHMNSNMPNELIQAKGGNQMNQHIQNLTECNWGPSSSAHPGNKAHNMSPPPRRVSLLASATQPCSDQVNFASEDTRNFGQGTNEGIQCPRSAGLDLLTRAANSLKLPKK